MSINKTEALHVAGQFALKGNLTAAIDIHRKIIESDPYDVTTILSLSNLYISAGKLEEALNFLSRTAHNLLSKGFRLKAAHILQKSLEIDPSNTSTRMELGEIYSYEGMVERAHDNFIAAGIDFLRKKDVGQALKAYNAALAIKPGSRQARMAIALLRDDTSSPSAIEPSRMPAPDMTTKNNVSGPPPPVGANAPGTSVHQTLENDSTFIIQKISMAERLVGYGKVDQAVAMLRELLEDVPENVDVHIKLKDIYLRTGEMEKAAEECLELSRIYKSRGEMAHAKKYMVRVRLLNPLIVESADEAIESQTVAEPANPVIEQEMRPEDGDLAPVSRPEVGEKPIISPEPNKSINWPANADLSILDTMTVNPSRASRERKPRIYTAAIAAVCLAVLAGGLTKGMLMYDARLDRQYKEMVLSSPSIVMEPPVIASLDQSQLNELAKEQENIGEAIQQDTSPEREKDSRRMSANERAPAPSKVKEPPAMSRRLSPELPYIMPVLNQQEIIDNGGRTPEGIPDQMREVPPPPAPTTTHKSGGVIKAEAIRKVDPVYPPLAKSSRQSGTVIVEVSINERGRVVSARAVSGPPLLRDAAVSAAKGWKFKPCTLSGKPIPSVNFITFNFKP